MRLYTHIELLSELDPCYAKHISWRIKIHFHRQYTLILMTVSIIIPRCGPLRNSLYSRSVISVWFCNCSSPGMFLTLHALLGYWSEHNIIAPLYAQLVFSIRIFYRGVPGFTTDCPCGIWRCKLITRLLHISPLFGNSMFKNSWSVSKKRVFHVFGIVYTCILT